MSCLEYHVDGGRNQYQEADTNESGTSLTPLTGHRKKGGDSLQNYEPLKSLEEVSFELLEDVKPIPHREGFHRVLISQSRQTFETCYTLRDLREGLVCLP